MAKAWKIRGLKTSESMITCAPLILRTRFYEMRYHSGRALNNHDAETVHDLRVSIRRMEAALYLCCGIFRRKDFRQYQRRLKRLINSFGKTRDHDEFLEMLEKLAVRKAPGAKETINRLTAEEKAERKVTEQKAAQEIRLFFTENHEKKFRQCLENPRIHSTSNKWPVSLKKSFRINGQKVVPFLFKKVFSQSKRVRNHPERQRDLHKMRIAAKPLRYIMELFEPAFTEGNYSACFKQVKCFVDVLGRIHDYDIAALKLQELTKEEKKYPDRDSKQNGRYVKCMQRPAKDISTERDMLFKEISATLKKWKKEHFKKKIALSLKP